MKLDEKQPWPLWGIVALDGINATIIDGFYANKELAESKARKYWSLNSADLNPETQVVVAARMDTYFRIKR